MLSDEERKVGSSSEEEQSTSKEHREENSMLVEMSPPKWKSEHAHGTVEVLAAIEALHCRMDKMEENITKCLLALPYRSPHQSTPSLRASLGTSSGSVGSESVGSITFKNDFNDSTDALPNAMSTIAVNNSDEEKPAADLTIPATDPSVSADSSLMDKKIEHVCLELGLSPNLARVIVRDSGS